MPDTFPTQLSDLSPQDPSTHPTLYTTLKHLKTSTLSLHNRLLSILTDATYISTVLSPLLPTLPLIANERCGSWYIPPRQKSGSAYFKSTDGHYGYWDLSLRRLNLQVLEVLGEKGGAVLVDSTRRGKRMPDALRRTVPVWVAVWNRVLFGGGRAVGDGGEEDGPGEWAFRLQHPGLEPGEVKLIEERIPGWVEGLKGLGLDLDEMRRKLKRPIRLCWVVHGEDIEVPDSDDEQNLFVLCSASRPVLGAEMSEDGYVQGAADDAEGWSGGLTAAVFWEHQEKLLRASEEELPELVERLVRDGGGRSGESAAVRVKPMVNLFLAAAPARSDGENGKVPEFDLVIDCHGSMVLDTPHTVHLGCRTGKLGSRDLREKLPLATERVAETLKKNANSTVLIMCENGRDLSVGVTATLLCLLYDEEGRFVTSQPSPINKQLVKKRLAWITSMKPDANPSRSTLQAVNSFLM